MVCSTVSSRGNISLRAPSSEKLTSHARQMAGVSIACKPHASAGARLLLHATPTMSHHAVGATTTPSHHTKLPNGGRTVYQASWCERNAEAQGLPPPRTSGICVTLLPPQGPWTSVSSTTWPGLTCCSCNCCECMTAVQSCHRPLPWIYRVCCCSYRAPAGAGGLTAHLPPSSLLLLRLWLPPLLWRVGPVFTHYCAALLRVHLCSVALLLQCIIAPLLLSSVVVLCAASVSTSTVVDSTSAVCFLLGWPSSTYHSPQGGRFRVGLAGGAVLLLRWSLLPCCSRCSVVGATPTACPPSPPQPYPNSRLGR
jgi:hypothetical protein